MKSKNNKIRYVQVTNENVEIAYNIQKKEWQNEPDKKHFIDRANKPKSDNVSFIVYYKDIPIGITGVYTEDIDNKSVWLDWFCVIPEFRRNGFGEQILVDTIEYARKLEKFLYFRLETNYWDGRPAISLYDKIMHEKEEYTIEETNLPILIYTYNFSDKREKWNNRDLGLNNYYSNLKS